MIIGTCSCCGGAVSVPDAWGGILPPTPTCTQCGAVAANSGPVIPMIKPTDRQAKWPFPREVRGADSAGRDKP